MSVSSVTKQGNSGEEKDAERGEKFKRYGWMCNDHLTFAYHCGIISYP
jgi:hypothetical protein